MGGTNSSFQYFSNLLNRLFNGRYQNQIATPEVILSLQNGFYMSCQIKNNSESPNIQIYGFNYPLNKSGFGYANFFISHTTEIKDRVTILNNGFNTTAPQGEGSAIVLNVSQEEWNDIFPLINNGKNIVVGYQTGQTTLVGLLSPSNASSVSTSIKNSLNYAINNIS
jgi:hypothetical protein